MSRWRDFEQFCIVGIHVRACSQIACALDSCWKSFCVASDILPTVTLNWMSSAKYKYRIASYDICQDANQLHSCGSRWYLSNSNWSACWFPEDMDSQILQIFTNHILLTHAARRQMLQLHCATIDDGGRGVLFLGPSGIGKTTQAERWAEFRGSSIINGDIGFVQRTGQGYLAWGTPWHGSSPYCLNASVPVKALVVLKQAPENRLRELTGFEKVTEVSGSVFYPTWLEDGMELCTDTLNHLLTDLPVYRLDNRADRESVEILAKELDRIT